MFEGPKVAGGVITLNLGAGCGASPQKFVWEGFGFIGYEW
jgi:hypothetical protein